MYLFNKHGVYVVLYLPQYLKFLFWPIKLEFWQHIWNIGWLAVSKKVKIVKEGLEKTISRLIQF